MNMKLKLLNEFLNFLMMKRTKIQGNHRRTCRSNNGDIDNIVLLGKRLIRLSLRIPMSRRTNLIIIPLRIVIKPMTQRIAM